MNSKASLKVTFITTVFNEQKTIKYLIDSLLGQTQYPNEVIVVDGGSTDNTQSIISNFKFPISNKMKIKIIEKKGNRSVGRNEAIRNSAGDIIVCSDAGNVLDKDWIKNITKPFNDSSVDVVAGYYRGEAKSVFQKCLIPYVLVMPDRVTANDFLPATRSMAFKKSVWEDLSGFDEKLSHNEDYDFARKLKKKEFKIVFARDAVVNWIPSNSLIKTFIMFFRFAYGDMEARIYRPKALFVIGRYLIGFILLGLQIYTHSLFILILIVVLVFNYLIWAIIKNYHYVKDVRAFVLLPFMQISSDMAVISGSVIGFFGSIGK